MDRLARPHRLHGIIALAGLGAALTLGPGPIEAQASSSSLPRSAESLPSGAFDAPSSVVVADLVLSYAMLEQALTDLGSDLAGSRGGSERLECADTLFGRTCLDADWNVDYRLSGPVQVGPQEGALRVVMPVRFDGRADLKGVAANLLGLDGRGFSKAVQVGTTLAMSFDENFCPIIEPGSLAFDWDQGADVEVGDGAGLGIDAWRLAVNGSLEEVLRDSLMELLQRRASIIFCQPVRDELARVWRTYAFPLDIEGMPVLFANLEPTALSISRLQVEEGGVRLIVRMAAQVRVSEERGPEAPITDLPSNQTTPSQDGFINLAVPLELSYPTIREQALAALGERPLLIDTPAGAAVLTVDDLRVHPGGGALALGVDVEIDAPGTLFDTHGKVWLAANPVVEADGTRVRLASVALLQQLESPVWNALAGAFQTRIEEGVTRAATYDLTAVIADASRTIQNAVASHWIEGVRFTLTDPDLRLGRIVVDDDALIVEGLATAGWSAEILALPH